MRKKPIVCFIQMKLIRVTYQIVYSLWNVYFKVLIEVVQMEILNFFLTPRIVRPGNRTLFVLSLWCDGLGEVFVFIIQSVQKQN